MPGDGRLPIIIVTGFLGSGKTTLLNRLMGDPAFRDSAILVNEFGDIGLDHELIASARENILLLDAGCLCCAIVDSLRETLADLYQKRATGKVPPFSRILIETSGLADPGPIIQTVMKDGVIGPLFRFAGLLCVVDALHAEVQLAESCEAREQVAMAERIVLTKAELADPNQVARLLARLRQANPTADLVRAPGGREPVAALFRLDGVGLEAEREEAAGEVRHHRHESNVGTESFRIGRPIYWSGVSAWTGHIAERFGDHMLRCKAVLPLASGGRILVQGVRRLFEIKRADHLRPSATDGVIICIGRHLDRDSLRRGLAWLEAPDGVTFPPSRDEAPWPLTLEEI